MYIYICIYVGQIQRRACDHMHYNQAAGRATFLSSATRARTGSLIYRNGSVKTLHLRPYTNLQRSQAY